MKWVQCLRCTNSCKKNNIHSLIKCDIFTPRLGGGEKPKKLTKEQIVALQGLLGGR